MPSSPPPPPPRARAAHAIDSAWRTERPARARASIIHHPDKEAPRPSHTHTLRTRRLKSLVRQRDGVAAHLQPTLLLRASRALRSTGRAARWPGCCAWHPWDELPARAVHSAVLRLRGRRLRCSVPCCLPMPAACACCALLLRGRALAPRASAGAAASCARPRLELVARASAARQRRGRRLDRPWATAAIRLPPRLLRVAHVGATPARRRRPWRGRRPLGSNGCRHRAATAAKITSAATRRRTTSAPAGRRQGRCARADGWRRAAAKRRLGVLDRARAEPPLRLARAREVGTACRASTSSRMWRRRSGACSRPSRAPPTRDAAASLAHGSRAWPRAPIASLARARAAGGEPTGSAERRHACGCRGSPRACRAARTSSRPPPAAKTPRPPSPPPVAACRSTSASWRARPARARLLVAASCRAAARAGRERRAPGPWYRRRRARRR